MTARVLLISMIIFVLNAGYVFAEETKAPGRQEVITAIIENSLGKGTKVLRIDKAEPSPVSGFTQTRVWIESPFGETPILIYASDDGKTYLAGSVFDAEGKNLTRRDVGETKPRIVAEADMKPSDDYTIGPKDAKVRVILWIGADDFSRAIYDAFSEIYRKNMDKVSLSLKFFPRSQQDAAKMSLLTCRKGNEAFEMYEKMKDFAPGWGRREDVAAYMEKHGLAEKDCDPELMRKDAQLSLDLKLPQQPLAFVNGTMMFEKPTSENVGKLAGVELK